MTSKSLHQLSPVAGKANRQDLDSDLRTLNNRVKYLRQQQQKQVRSIRLNKEKAKQLLAKKVMLSQLGNSININLQQEQELRLDQLRKKNKTKKLRHEKELQNITKAIYLVKADDARQIRNMSQQHRIKMEQFRHNSIEQSKHKKLQAYKAAQRRKQHQMRYIKQKMIHQTYQQRQNLYENQTIKQQKISQLQQLEREEARLVNNITKRYSESVVAKQEYYSAMALPMRSVTKSMEKMNKKSYNRQISSPGRSTSIGTYTDRTVSLSDIQDMRVRNNDVRVPSTKVDEVKLRIVLEQLKRINQKNR